MESETKKESEQETKKSANKALWITGIIIVIVLIALFTNGFGLFGKKNVATTLSIDNSPVLGNVNAPVTIYEFSDFSCPYCEASEGYNQPIIDSLKQQDPTWQPAVPNIISQYVNTGKAKLIFKYTEGHGAAQPAHIVGYCLNDQNLYWNFSDLAFKNYQDALSYDKMKALAQSLGANMTELSSCIDFGKYTSKLTEDQQMGAQNGVQGTPTFFINGIKVEGAQSFSVLQKIIDSQLK